MVRRCLPRLPYYSFCVTLVLCIIHLSALGKESGDWDDDDNDEDTIGFAETQEISVASRSQRRLTLKGYLKYRFGLWLERPQSEMPSTSRVSTDVEARYKHNAFRAVLGVRLDHDAVYELSSRGYDQATRNTYGRRLFGQDMFLAYAPKQFELSIGRQRVAWGEGDSLSPSDLVTPYDQREFGLADLDDIRRPRLLTRLNWFEGSSRLELIVAHEAYYGERPTPLSEYSPLRANLSSPAVAALTAGRSLDFASEQKGFHPDYWDYFARWNYTGSGIDLGGSIAYTRDRQGVLTFDPSQLAGDGDIELTLQHLAFLQIAQTGALPLDSWLLKWESAFTWNEPMNTGNLDTAQIEYARVNRLIQMLGLSYTGISDHTLAIETQRSFGLTSIDDPLFPVELTIINARIVGTYLRERLRVVLAGSLFGIDPHLGQFYRLETNYEARDGFRMGLMYVHYNPSDGEDLSPLSGLNRHEQVIAQVRWDFQH